MPEPGLNGSPISVGVFVDLELRPEAGGHVKCWERFAAAAVSLPDALDLTVHFAGDEEAERPIAENVRYRIHRPVFSTRRLPFLRGNPDHTDLARRHPAVAAHLPGYRVLHATDAYFAFAKTIRAYAKRSRKPLVSSTHTDTPKYTRLFTRDAIHNAVGRGWASRFLLDRLRVAERAGRSMERRLDAYLAGSDHVLASSDADFERARGLLPPERVSRLRRGIDKEFFHPRWRDRDALSAAHGVPADRFLLVFVGRVDASKSPLVLAESVRSLAESGLPVHALFVGRGGQRAAVAEAAGPYATLIGSVSQDALRTIYASGDLFAFPSTTELMPNVVVEAKASGLPAILSARGGSAQMVSESSGGMLIDSEDAADWAEAIRPLVDDRVRRDQMARAARAEIESAWPTWADVLVEDLLPVWRRVAEVHASRAVG